MGAVIVAALILAPSARAAYSNDPLAFVLNGQGSGGHYTADPVDYLTWCGDCVGVDYTTGSPWVVNPRDSWPYGLPANGAFEPGCMWDSDDSYSYVSTGNILAAGASVSVTECRYSAGFGTNGCCPQLATNIWITSPSPNLIVTERWDSSTTVVHQIPAVFDPSAHLWRYFACVWSPSLVSGDQLVTIPNSHGGTGTPQLITVTVTNPTSRKVNKTGGVIESGLIHGSSRGCQSWEPA